MEVSKLAEDEVCHLPIENFNCNEDKEKKNGTKIYTKVEGTAYYL